VKTKAKYTASVCPSYQQQLFPLPTGFKGTPISDTWTLAKAYDEACKGLQHKGNTTLYNRKAWTHLELLYKFVAAPHLYTDWPKSLLVELAIYADAWGYSGYHHCIRMHSVERADLEATVWGAQILDTLGVPVLNDPSDFSTLKAFKYVPAFMWTGLLIARHYSPLDMLPGLLERQQQRPDYAVKVLHRALFWGVTEFINLAAQHLYLFQVTGLVNSVWMGCPDLLQRVSPETQYTELLSLWRAVQGAGKGGDKKFIEKVVRNYPPALQLRTTYMSATSPPGAPLFNSVQDYICAALVGITDVHIAQPTLRQRVSDGDGDEGDYKGGEAHYIPECLTLCQSLRTLRMTGGTVSIEQLMKTLPPSVHTLHMIGIKDSTTRPVQLDLCAFRPKTAQFKLILEECRVDLSHWERALASMKTYAPESTMTLLRCTFSRCVERPSRPGLAGRLSQWYEECELPSELPRDSVTVCNET